MAYTYEQRETIALTDTVYQRRIGGALWRIARYLYDVDHSERAANEMRIILSVLADVSPYVVSAGRAVLNYPAMDALTDVTTLTDAQVQTQIEGVWPMLVSAWTGEVAAP